MDRYVANPGSRIVQCLKEGLVAGSGDGFHLQEMVHIADQWALTGVLYVDGTRNKDCFPVAVVKRVPENVSISFFGLRLIQNRSAKVTYLDRSKRRFFLSRPIRGPSRLDDEVSYVGGSPKHLLHVKTDSGAGSGIAGG